MKVLNVVPPLMMLLILAVTSCTAAPPGTPVANAGGDQTVTVGDTVTLDGSGSSGDDLTFEWAFESQPASSAAELENTDAAEASFVADVAGEYQVTLTVTNDAGSDTDAVSITASEGGGEGTLEPGETYTGEDGVVLGALEGALEAALEVAVRGEAPPDISLPESAQALGEFYRLSAVQDTFSADNPFLVALPVPEGADTSSLALAVLLEPEDVEDADLEEPTWELLEGVYDPENNYFITTLPFLAAEGRVVVLVSAEEFESPGLGAAPEVSPQQNSDFRVRCRRFGDDEWNNRDITCSSADEADLESALEEAYGDFTGLGFTEPYLRKRIVHVSLFPLSIVFGEYLANLHPFRDVAEDEDTWRCGRTPDGSGNLGGYSSGSKTFYVCIGNDGVTNRAVETGRHEYFHATQYGYKSVRQSNQTWVKEGTATASEGSLTVMMRDNSRGVHPTDISLTAEDDDTLYQYEAQDFFIYSGLALGSGLDYLTEVFREGASVGEVDSGLKNLGVSGGLAAMYWDWAKNQSFEKAVDLGGGVLGNTCSFNADTVENLASHSYDGTSANILDTYRLDPLTSQVVRFDFGVFPDADYEAQISVSNSSSELRVKFFDAADAGTTDCFGDPEGPQQNALVRAGESRTLYALISNTSLTQTRSVSLSIAGEPTVTISEPEPGSAFDESDDITFLAEATGFGSDADITLSWRYDRYDGVPFTFGSTEPGEAITWDFCDGSYDVTAEALEGAIPTGVSATVRVVVNDLGSSNPPPECAPVISIDAPTDGATFALGSAIAFGATIDDDHPETDEPLYPILWRDGGPDGLIIARDTLTFSRDKFSEGEHLIHVEYGAASDSVTIDVVDTTNTPPTAEITSPEDGSDFFWYDYDTPYLEVDFSGRGTDAEDGALTGDSLSWSYREQGTTQWSDGGTDEQVTIRFNYTCDNFNFYDIRLKATDSEGLFDTDDIEIGVQSPPC